MKKHFEFHIAAHVRKVYRFKESLFSTAGNVIFANFTEVRNFVHEFNKNRNNNDKVNAGNINAAGLLDEIYHYLMSKYEKEINPNVFQRLIANLQNKYGTEKVYDLVFDFTTIFPPEDVYKNKVSVKEYLEGETDGKPNLVISLEELILLHLDNYNPSNKKIIELINEKYLSDSNFYNEIIIEVDKFFDKEPTFGPEHPALIKMMKEPIDAHPDDIESQLIFIQEKWEKLIGSVMLSKLLRSKDFIKENRVITMGGGTTPTFVPQYKKGGAISDAVIGRSGYNYGADSFTDYEEYESFTSDIDWMPRVVLMAKNIHVWLDQLSKKYKKEIRHLDQIPDEEIDQLVKWGFNGLWLIGLWERSNASRKIKHIMGNVDAVASAYSLFDYEIAHDLGGDEAYNRFNEKARRRGLRLASDMVPNHTGIFSRWVLEHPDYFVQSDVSPFPNYTFTGTDLSDDPKVQIRIEDGYWEKRDAAVVFQRIDNRTGEVKYFYHGNDGTNMPWNDTAQLNMLKPEVREAVIQKIFDVARKFSIIRFDAAMTLTKKHFSRLWYPQPGTGGDIPSRADYSLTRTEFDDHFPKEFWREVVDRINDELPETLLLAEAFWLMEGYFVRTLGMHRVYNSAFMHMLMKEENEKYRDLITNTLEFEPEILKRYVNFMSNPDEETAIKQFGTDDKYFGVAVLMVTLPGLPMFAHGQIEGFTEKYGMEYQRAYYNEIPKDWLVDRHLREVFPLMKKRYLFSGVDNFWLFDLIDSFGRINENVFAYTNRFENESALVFYNNKYERASGHIRRSVQKLVNSNSAKRLENRSLQEALGLQCYDNTFISYREHISGREYLITASELCNNGFHIELNGFECKLFWNFRVVEEDTELLSRVRANIGYDGTEDLNVLIQKYKYEYLHNSIRDLFHKTSKGLCIYEEKDYKVKDVTRYLDDVSNLFYQFTDQIEEVLGKKAKKCKVTFAEQLKSMAYVFTIINRSKSKHVLGNLLRGDIKEYYKYITTLSILNHLKLMFSEDFDKIFLETLLNYPVRELFAESGKGEFFVKRMEVFILELTEISSLYMRCNSEYEITEEDIKEDKLIRTLLGELLKKDDIQNLLNVNEYEGVSYFSKEAFHGLVVHLLLLVVISSNAYKLIETDIEDLVGDSKLHEKQMAEIENSLLQCSKELIGLDIYAEKIGYNFEVLCEPLSE